LITILYDLHHKTHINGKFIPEVYIHKQFMNLASVA